MRRAILRALSKNRDERQESAKQFYADLAGANPLTAERAMQAASTGTAAMERAPDFAAEPARAGMNPTAGMPGPGGYAAPPVAPPVQGHVAHAVPTPARAKSGGGKGLVIGLAAAGGVLLIAIVIVLASSMKPEPDEPLTNPMTTSSGVATIAPQIDVPDTGVGSVATHDVDAGAVVAEKPRPDPTPTQTPQKQKPKTETPKPVSTVTGAAACDACLSAAQSGNVQGAAAHLNRCDDPTKKQRCRNMAVGRAPGVIQAAAFNGNCAQARALNAAVRSMGGRDMMPAGACK
jgi:serine/threonine-protein kinase